MVWLQAKDNQRAIGDAFLAHVKVASPELFLQWGAPSAWMELAEEGGRPASRLCGGRRPAIRGPGLLAGCVVKGFS